MCPCARLAPSRSIPRATMFFLARVVPRSVVSNSPSSPTGTTHRSDSGQVSRAVVFRRKQIFDQQHELTLAGKLQ